MKSGSVDTVGAQLLNKVSTVEHLQDLKMITDFKDSPKSLSRLIMQ